MSFNEQAAYTSKYNNGVAQRTMPFREARKQANTRKRALASSDLSQKILWKLHTAWPLWDHLTFYILLFECFILFTFKCMCMSFQAENSPIQYYTLYKHIILLIKILQYNWLTYIKRISSINYVCISQNPPFHKLQTSVVVHPGVNPKVPTSQLLPKKVMCMDTSFLKTQKNIIKKQLGSIQYYSIGLQKAPLWVYANMEIYFWVDIYFWGIHRIETSKEAFFTPS